MKTFGLTIALLFCTSLSCFSCEVPTRPVHASMWILDGKIRTEITNNILYWRDKVLGKGAVTTGSLPEELQQKAEDYINESFILEIDGKPLRGEIIRYRYIENPWTDKKRANAQFLLNYTADTTAGKKLKIKSIFFFKEHSVHAGDHEHHHCPFHDYGLIEHEFTSYLNIRTGRGLRIELPVQKPEVEVDIDQYRQTFFQYKYELFKYGLQVLMYVFSFCLFLLVWFLFPVSFNDSIKYMAVLAVSIFIGMVSENYLFRFSDTFIPCLFGLAGIMVVCVFNYFKQGAEKINIFFGALGVFWGMLFSNRLVTFYMYDRPQISSLTAHLLGIMVVSALFLFAENRMVTMFKKYLYKKSQSMAEKKFLDNIKFLLMIILITSGIFMFHLIKYRVGG